VTHNNSQEKGTGAFRQDQTQLVFSQGFSFSGYERDGVYLSRANRKFTDISGVSGMDSISDGRAAVFADFDNDGDLDVFVTTIQGPSHLLFRNNIGQENHSLRLALQGGPRSGRDAFGSVVRIKTSAGILTKVKAGGEGFLSQHDPRLLFGLAKDERPEWVEVTWSDGKIERFEGDFQAGNFLLLREETGKAETIPLLHCRLPDPLTKAEEFSRSLRLQLGKPMPELEVKPIGHPAVSLGKVHQAGRRMLVNLWATWCLPCRTEMPELDKLRPKLAARGIDLIGINVDVDPHRDVIQEFLQKTPVSYPVFIGGVQAIERIYSSDEITVPLSFLVDEQGKVVEIFPGWNAETKKRFMGLADSAEIARPKM
jgi:thiol-disulfide isomerase/thioredoxin